MDHPTTILRTILQLSYNYPMDYPTTILQLSYGLPYGPSYNYPTTILQLNQSQFLTLPCACKPDNPAQTLAYCLPFTNAEPLATGKPSLMLCFDITW